MPIESERTSAATAFLISNPSLSNNGTPGASARGAKGSAISAKRCLRGAVRRFAGEEGYGFSTWTLPSPLLNLSDVFGPSARIWM
jgi:hypothetical protein